MKKVLAPLNVSLLVPQPQQLKLLQPITSLDIFDGPGGNFHDAGLFSTLIFGRVGDPIRDRQFGYIDLRIPVLHPIVFRTMSKLRGLYGEIMQGTAYALWDAEKGDFTPASELEGKTGYEFFAQHWKQIAFTKTTSSVRNVRIQLIDKYRDQSEISHLLVMPAGLRDADVETDGRPSVPEINEFYQRVLMLVRNFPERINPADDLSTYDRTRYNLQLQFVGLYDYIEGLISGKRGFIQERWASRRVFNGTRNVLSSLDTTTADLDLPNRPKFNDTVIGLYQAAKSVQPKVIYHLRNSIAGQVFDTSTNRVELINKETLQLEWVEIANQDLDRWGTEEGMEKVIGTLEVLEKRGRAIEIAGHYLALVYKTPDSFRVFRDMRDFPADFDKSLVFPLTYVELIYIAGLPMWLDNSAFVTRYPVENYNSSIPSKQYVKTTIEGLHLKQLGGNWEVDPDLPEAYEYPLLRLGQVVQYYDATSVSPSRLAPLTADFDGDTVSFNSLYSREAIDETDRYFKTRAAYIQATGGLSFSISIDPMKLTLAYMTGPKDS